jgi:hypothetical protein
MQLTELILLPVGCLITRRWSGLTRIRLASPKWNQYLGRAMRQASRAFAVVLLALLHLAATAGIASGHLHPAKAWYGAPQGIESHDCGPREIHRPLDSNHQCLPCHRFTNTFARIVAVQVAAQLVENFFRASEPRSITVDDFASVGFTRGPPSFPLS